MGGELRVSVKEKEQSKSYREGKKTGGPLDRLERINENNYQFLVPTTLSTITRISMMMPTTHMQRLTFLHHAAFSQRNSSVTAIWRRVQPSTSVLIRFSRSLLGGRAGSGSADATNQGTIAMKPVTKQITWAFRQLKKGSPLSSRLGAFHRLCLCSIRSSLCK
jgi:hypothetical protein